MYPLWKRATAFSIIRKLGSVLVRSSIAVLKYHDQKQFEGSLFSLHCHITVYHKRKSEQEAESRNWSRSHERMMLTGLIFVTCWACFLIALRNTCPGMVSPTVTWALPTSNANTEKPYRLATGNLMDISPIRSILANSSLCQIGKNNKEINMIWTQPRITWEENFNEG